MPLDFQVVDVKFNQGMDTHTQAKLVIPGKWNTLNNLTVSEDTTTRRRDGVATLITSANGNGLALHDKELLLVNGSTLSSISTAGTDAAIARSGELGYVTVSKEEIQSPASQNNSPDVAYGDGLTAYVWRNTAITGNPEIRCAIVDQTTGTKILNNQLLRSSATLFGPRVVYSQGAFFFLYADDEATPVMYCTVVATTAPTVLGTEVPLITSTSLSPLAFDACSFADTVTSSVMLAYAWQDGTTSFRTVQVVRTGTVPALGAGPTNLQAQATVANLTITCVGCKPFSQTRAAAFFMSSGGGAGGGVWAAVIDASWAVTTAATRIDAAVTVAALVVFGVLNHITATLNGANLQIFYDQAAGLNLAALRTITSTTVSSTLAVISGPTVLANSATFATTAGSGLPTGPQGPFIIGKAFTSTAGNVLLPCCMFDALTITGATVTNGQQNVFFLFDGATGNIVAKALYSALGFTSTATDRSFPSCPCSTPSPSSNVFIVGLMEKTRITNNGALISASLTGIVGLFMTPNATIAPIKAQLGESTYFAGGQVTSYDGGVLNEHGFPLFPEGINAVNVAGGGSMVAGVHQVVAVYEYFDSAGNRHQSAPSLAVSVTTATLNDSMTVVVPTLLVSQKMAAAQPGINIVLYMTQAGGTTFNRLTSVTAPVANVTTATGVTFTVTASDASILSNELLYTQPNEDGTTLPNLPPPPSNVLGLHQNRIFTDKADEPGVFRFSQQLAANTGLQFSDDLGGTVDRNSGAIVGFASMDEKLIIFCQRKPYVIYGAGPNAAGDASGGYATYSRPQEVPSDVGCVEARSILKMPMGIIFKSEQGWYMMGRDLTVRYIGEGVASFDANNVSSAVLLEDRQECRFSSSDGASLIYSYAVVGEDGLGQWTTSVVSAGAAAAYHMNDAVWWPTPTSGGYYHVSTTLGLNYDTPGVYLDAPGGNAGVAIVTTAVTSWLHPGVMEGFQRIRRLYVTGTSPNAPTSSLRITVDYDDAYGAAAPGAYNFTTILSTITFPTGMPIDLRAKLRRQKCKSIAFTFTDTPTTGNPAGINLQALALEIGRKRGPNKLPAAQSVG